MNIPLPHPRHRRAGVALVIILACVVLVTFLIVAFFSRAMLNRQIARSSAGQTKADNIATAAVDTLVSDLRQEIVSGSYNASDWPHLPTPWPSVKPVYEPRPEKLPDGSIVALPGMLPMRWGAPALPGPTPQADFPYNLVRRSARMDPAEPAISSAYSGLSPRRGSPVNSSTDPSVQGTRVSPARWNKPLLLPLANPASPSDNTPAATFTPPDWIIVTRGSLGTNPATGQAFQASDIATLKDASPGNPNFAIGRFAYTVYDEGGLVDVNFAGYIPSATGSYPAPTQAEIARKGPLGLVDLSQIPGVLDPSSLIQWRNAFTAKSGSFAAEKFPSASSSDYIKYLFNPKLNAGFLRTYPGDQSFLGRQDLLDYAAANPSQITRAALQFLGTFTRDINAPSWSPANPVIPGFQVGQATSSTNYTPLTLATGNSTIDYEGQANATAASARAYRSTGLSLTPAGGGKYSMPIPNRNLLTAVWSQDRTIKDWDGNTQQVKTGEPIVRRRFPLSRLDLFRQYYAASGSDKATLAQKIKYSFGLVPDDAQHPNQWVYNSYVYDSAWDVFRLFTVDEMDAVAPANAQNFENRELNFFELLRAGILHGDVGVNADVDDQDAANMIVKIGANIIDQYHSDNYPTLIQLKPPNPKNPGQYAPAGKQICGIKNLPYISEVIPHAYRKTADPLQVPELKNVWYWIECELWNPHSNAGINVSGPDSPDTFRLVGYSGEVWLKPSPINVWTGFDTQIAAFPTYFDSTHIDLGTNYGDSTPYQVQFKYPATSDFADPAILGSADAANSLTWGDQTKQVFNETYGGVSYTIAGLAMGYSDNPGGWPDIYLSPIPPPPPPPALPPVSFSAQYGVVDLVAPASLPMLFTLEFLDTRNGQHRWVPYQSFATDPNNLNPDLSLNHHGLSAGSGTAYSNAGTNTGTGTDAPNPGSFRDLGHIGLDGYPTVDPRFTEGWVPNGQHGTASTPGFSIRPEQVTRGVLPWQTTWGNYGKRIINDVVRNDGSYKNMADLVENKPTSLTCSLKGGTFVATMPVQVRGRDNILRPGDGDADRGVYPVINSRRSKDESTSPGMYLKNIISNTPGLSALVNSSRLDDRPLMLGRPFESVGDLAYAFRNMPWKTLNFSSSVSAESALLDLFCINETPFSSPVSAGTVNLNSARHETLTALLAGSCRKDDASVAIPPASAGMIATDFETMRKGAPLWSTGKTSTLLRHRSDLVNSFWRYLEDNNLIPKATTQATAEPYPAIKTRQEAIVRAWGGGATTTRTWNLLIDIVAQAGRFTPTATTLANFSVQGEKRYWLHVSIDRFTGQIIDQQLEPVYE